MRLKYTKQKNNKIRAYFQIGSYFMDGSLAEVSSRTTTHTYHMATFSVESWLFQNFPNLPEFPAQLDF